MKKRFECLLRYRTLEYTLEKAGQVINACVVLHNMCIRANLPPPPEPEETIMCNGLTFRSASKSSKSDRSRRMPG